MFARWSQEKFKDDETLHLERLIDYGTEEFPTLTEGGQPQFFTSITK